LFYFREDKLYTFYPFIKYNNHHFFNTNCIVENAEKHLKAVKEFDSLENDVILATPLKSGRLYDVILATPLKTGK
jgi:hypothetical protein